MSASMPVYMRYMCTGLFLVVLVTCWFFFVYRVINQRMDAGVHQVRAMNERAHTLATACQQKENLTTTCAALQSKTTVENHDTYAITCVLTLLDAIRSSQMAIVSYSTDQQRAKSGYALHPIHITMHGTLPHLQHCLNALAGVAIPFTYSRCAFQKQDKDSLYTITLDMKYSAYACSDATKRPSNLEQAEGLGG